MWRTTLFLAALMGAGLAASAAELPAQRASFTADGVVQIHQDRVSYKVYHLAGKERQEMRVDGLYQINILRPDLDRAWVVQPEANSSIELPLDEVRFLPTPGAPGHHVVDEIGQAREGGEVTTKYRVSSTAQAERRLDVLLWVTDDGITMRVEGEVEFEGEMENVMLLRRDVARGPLDPAIFEPQDIPMVVGPEAVVPEGHGETGTEEP